MEKILDALEILEKNIKDDKIKKIYIDILMRAFEMKTLHIAGISPYLDKCIICGNLNNTLYYSISEGGLICSKCRNIIKDSSEITEDDKAFMKIIKHSTLIETVNNEKLIYIYINSVNTSKDIMNKSLYNHISRNIKSSI